MDKNCDQQKRFFRPRRNVIVGIEFHRFLIESVKKIVNNDIVQCKEDADKIFSMNPHLLNMTVKEFFDTPTVTDVLLDYINELDLDKPLVGYKPNKGYDFPEDYENKSLLRVVKDFVRYAIYCIIPENTSKALNISYARIVKTAMVKMSSREFRMVILVFRKTEPLFQLKDVCARLSIVALYVIFDKYIKDYRRKNRKI
ncbi:hypothetical protein AVEN_243820-1 [Araneus ventricosus]|uniref:Uncharacterized protein n=1 Tax=Araneus ventricosus TaxID=182803 RepID=A0A4Y2A5G5_ARAVE|nr:hypothetical protein AVEN_243820-1 [Araneus ventricosus]